MSAAGLLSIEWEITDQHLPMPHIVATACAAFVEEVERRGLVIRSGPSPQSCTRSGSSRSRAKSPSLTKPSRSRARRTHSAAAPPAASTSTT